MAAPGPAEVKAGPMNIGVTAYYNDCVPLQLYQEKIMVDITGPATKRGKTAMLDLVLVLDTSESMGGMKLQHMKQAVDFVIRKIGAKDTLTIVSCSDKAKTLMQMSGDDKRPARVDDKKPARMFVQGLTARGKTNIKDGLHTAIRILRDRERQNGHATGVFLISNGKQDNFDAKDVRHVKEFPVFTFGFGQQHDHQLLHDIARRSYGGTYHNVQRSDDNYNLIWHVAKVLAILRDVSAVGLMVTLKPHAGATIMELKSGNCYNKTYRQDDGFPTIDFGDLAREEHRKMLVVIVFPPVRKDERAKNVMTVACSYRLPNEEKRITTTLDINIARKREPGPHRSIEHFQVELARFKHAGHIQSMKKLADGNKFDEVSNVLQQATEDLNIRSTNDTINKQLEALRLELEQLQRRFRSQNTYKEIHGEAYLLAATLSHERQRYAVRGGADDVMLYAMTKRALKYESHVKLFLRNADTTEI